MTYVPDKGLLRGLSYEEASCFGMPHIGAYYAGRSVNSNRLVEGAICQSCGHFASNSHHEPPKGMGGGNAYFTLHGVVMKPALIAICGSGTTGCHNRRHRNALKVRWVWDSDEHAEDWWSGRMFERGIEPHDKALYRYGRWRFTDMQFKESWEVRL